MEAAGNVDGDGNSGADRAQTLCNSRAGLSPDVLFFTQLFHSGRLASVLPDERPESERQDFQSLRAVR